MSGERKQWRYLPARRFEMLEAEIERLTTEVTRLAAQDLACALEWYRMRSEVDRLRSTLQTLRAWDMLDACSDGPWAKALIDTALGES